MLTGWKYRGVSLGGVALLTIVAVLAANQPVSQSIITTYVPLFDRLDPTVLTGTSLYWAIGLTVAAVVVSLVPLYKPRPRRLLDTVFLAQKRIVVAMLALATLGYFNWSHRVPRTTLVMIAGLLAVTVPLWFVWIRRPDERTGRTLLVGDDLQQFEQVAPTVGAPLLGYLCPTNVTLQGGGLDENEVIADGGVAISRDGATIGNAGPDGLAEVERAIDEYGRLGAMTRLGGLSRLEETLVEYDVDTVVLAFSRPDRAEFFGALETCYEHGVNAKVHREYANSVLVSANTPSELVDVDLDPWDPQDYLFKRAFDVVFATAGLVLFAPFMLVIAAAIKLDSSGPVFYEQARTAGFGETFPVYKFRTMIPEGEDVTPTEDDENDRITRVGRLLRKTHLDELPQLWSILVGEMSVVGPRAVWTEEEELLERDAIAWRKRWFVKPGLTGLAQVNDAKSTDPGLKLRYDLEYIQRQSFWLDVKIVIRQVWKVAEDVLTLSSGH